MIVFFGQIDYNSNNKPNAQASVRVQFTLAVTRKRKSHIRQFHVQSCTSQPVTPAKTGQNNRPKHPVFPDNNELFRT